LTDNCKFSTEETYFEVFPLKFVQNEGWLFGVGWPLTSPNPISLRLRLGLGFLASALGLGLELVLVLSTGIRHNGVRRNGSTPAFES